MNLLPLSLFVVFLSLQVKSGNCFRRTCYYIITNDTNLAPSQIQGDLCTHLLVGFVPVVNGTLTPRDSWDETVYREVLQLKVKNPSLRVMVTTKSDLFQVSLNDKNRQRFAASTVGILAKLDLDGLDIDWEFPVWSSGRFEEKANFVLLLKELRASFDGHQQSTGRTLEVSVAVAADVTIIIPAYNIPQMAKYVDFINIMCYDYYDFKWFYPITGHNSALFRRKHQTTYFSTLNTEWSANYWHSKGMPKEKIMVGIPTYSHSYRLLYPRLNKVGAPTIGAGEEYSYGQVCDLLKKEGTVRVFDTEAKVPYLYNGNLWVSYEDEESATEKANWIKSQGFGGSMTFDLNCDDFEYKCSNVTKFVLHNLIRSILP